jgi:hypothetical protein
MKHVAGETVNRDCAKFPFPTARVACDRAFFHSFAVQPGGWGQDNPFDFAAGLK